MTPEVVVAIQHAEDTHRFHPTLYRLAPWPGAARPGLVRYKSAAHHTEGFATLPEARTNAVELLRHYGLPLPLGGIGVYTVSSAGPDVAVVPEGRNRT